MYRHVVPLTIEAIHLTPESVQRAAGWCKGVPVEEWDEERTKKFVGLDIPTLYGVKRAHENDYIIKNSAGDFSVMTQEEFEEKYEQAV